jgi:hypothetical protein
MCKYVSRLLFSFDPLLHRINGTEISLIPEVASALFVILFLFSIFL